MGTGWGQGTGRWQEGWGRPTDMSRIYFFRNSNDTSLFKSLAEDSILLETQKTREPSGRGTGVGKKGGGTQQMSKIFFFRNPNDTSLFKTLVEDSILLETQKSRVKKGGGWVLDSIACVHSRTDVVIL